MRRTWIYNGQLASRGNKGPQSIGDINGLEAGTEGRQPAVENSCGGGNERTMPREMQRQLVGLKNVMALNR